MNTQINLRLSDDILRTAEVHTKIHGFNNLQEFIKEAIREKLFEINDLTKEELFLVSKLVNVSNEKNLYGTEDELWDKLDEK